VVLGRVWSRSRLMSALDSAIDAGAQGTHHRVPASTPRGGGARASGGHSPGPLVSLDTQRVGLSSQRERGGRVERGDAEGEAGWKVRAAAVDGAREGGRAVGGEREFGDADAQPGRGQHGATRKVLS